MADVAKNFLKVIAGLVLIILPIWLVLAYPGLRGWGQAALDVIQGSIVIGVILIGLLFLVLGFTGLKE